MQWLRQAANTGHFYRDERFTEGGAQTLENGALWDHAKAVELDTKEGTLLPNSSGLAGCHDRHGPRV